MRTLNRANSAQPPTEPGERRYGYCTTRTGSMAGRYKTVHRQIGLVLIGLGRFVAILNWTAVIASHRTGRFHSAVPLIGAVLLANGLALLPRTRHYAWAAILVDYGPLILLISLPRLVREAWETSRYNFVAEYRGGRGIMEARIGLYRGGIGIIKYDSKRAPSKLGMVSTSLCCHLRLKSGIQHG